MTHRAVPRTHTEPAAQGEQRLPGGPPGKQSSHVSRVWGPPAPSRIWTSSLSTACAPGSGQGGPRPHGCDLETQLRGETPPRPNLQLLGLMGSSPPRRISTPLLGTPRGRQTLPSEWPQLGGRPAGVWGNSLFQPRHPHPGYFLFQQKVVPALIL